MKQRFKTLFLTKCLFSTLLMAFPSSLISAPEGWLEDFELAQKTAAQEKKNILVFFTGSDWCGLCRQLENNILSKKEFQDRIKKQYVFLYVDSPRDQNRIPPKNRVENPKLCKKYSIRGNPTILLMTSDGSVFGRAGHKNTSPKEYADMLLSQTKSSIIPNLRLSIQKMPKGLARARAIDAVLSQMSSEAQSSVGDLVKEIYDADPDGKLGLSPKYFVATKLNPILSEVASISEIFVFTNISYKKKSPAEKEAKFKELREKHSPRLMELRSSLQKMKVNAPQSSQKTIMDTISGINSLLGK